MAEKALEAHNSSNNIMELECQEMDEVGYFFLFVICTKLIISYFIILGEISLVFVFVQS